MSTSRPPAEDVAIQLAIDEGLEVAETTHWPRSAYSGSGSPELEVSKLE